jgi:hypothetical protein
VWLSGRALALYAQRWIPFLALQSKEMVNSTSTLKALFIYFYHKCLHCLVTALCPDLGKVPHQSQTEMMV